MLITSELINQSARKALFTCVVYTKVNYRDRKSPTFEKKKKYMNLNCIVGKAATAMPLLFWMVSKENDSD